MNDDIYKQSCDSFCKRSGTASDDSSPRLPRRYLFLSQWFADADGWGYFESLSRRFAQDGSSVETLTGAFPYSYSEKAVSKSKKSGFWRTEMDDSVRVVRLPSYQSHTNSGLKRFFSYSSFGLAAALFGLFLTSRSDVVFCYTFPTLGWAARLFRLFRGTKIVVFALDLWPDSVVDSGMMRNRFLLKILSRWCLRFYRSADAVVVPTPGIKQKLIERGVAPEKVFFLYLWTSETAPAPTAVLNVDGAPSDGEPSGSRPFIVLYAGSIGSVQALDVVLDAALLLERENANVVFRLVGGGIDCERLKKRSKELGLDSVIFKNRVPKSEIAYEFERADALLIHLKKTELFRTTIPSKTQAYLLAGKPILCGVSGDASDLVEKAGAGMSFESENPVELARAVRKLQRLSPEERERTGRNGSEFYRKNLTMDVACRRLEKMLDFLFFNVER